MANNYQQSTVNTLIPIGLVTGLELDLLAAHGYQHEVDRACYYFFSEDGAYDDMGDGEIIDNEADYFNISEKNIETVFINPEDSVYFDDTNNLKQCTSTAIFQNIIKRSGGGIPYIEIESAYYCDKFRQGEFGGFAQVITADKTYEMGTSSFIRDTVKEIKAANQLAKEENNEDMRL